MNRTLVTQFLLIGLGSLSFSSALASTHYVGKGSGYVFNTVQSAIDGASNGDTIVVTPGTYTEDIHFMEKRITLTTEDPTDPVVRATTVLAPSTPIYAFTNGVLEGFRINAEVRFGQNIGLNSYSPTIRHNNIVTNGIAIHAFVGYQQPTATPVIENNLIRARTGIYMNTQAFAQGLSPVIRQNTIINRFDTNGSGIQLRSHKELPEITNNIIMGFDYGVHFTYMSNFDNRTPLILHNNVLAGIYGYYVSSASGTGDLDFDLTGTQGNLAVDPMFIGLNNFRLSTLSPLVDAGGDTGVLSDLDGRLRPYDLVGVDNNGALPDYDIGAYETILVPEPATFCLVLTAAIGISRLRYR